MGRIPNGIRPDTTRIQELMYLDLSLLDGRNSELSIDVMPQAQVDLGCGSPPVKDHGQRQTRLYVSDQTKLVEGFLHEAGRHNWRS